MTVVKRWYEWLLYIFFIMTVLIGFLAFERKVSTFRPLGFYFKNDPPKITQIEAGSNPELAGLYPGDVILEVNEELATEENLRSLLHSNTQGVTLTINRDHEIRTIFLQLPRGEVDLTYLLYSFTGFIILIIGIFSFVKKKKRGSIVFFWITLFTFQILVFQPSGKLNDLWRTILGFQFMAKLLLPMTLLHFSLIFPRNIFRKVSAILPFLYFFPAALLVTTVDLLFLDRLLNLGEEAIYTINILRTIWIIFAILATIIIFSLQWILIRTIFHKRQLQWILLGLAIGFLPYLLFHLIPVETGLRLGVPPALFIPLLAFMPLTTTYALWEYKIWDVASVIREVLSYAITIIIGIVVYFFCYNLLNLLPGSSITLKYFLLFAAGFTIAILFFPIHRGIENLLIRVQYGTSFHKHQQLLDFSRRIPLFSTLTDLLVAFSSQLKKTLQVDRCNFYIHRKERFHRFEDDDILPPVLFPEDAKEWSPSSSYSSVFPIRFQENLLALLVVGERETGVPLSTEEKTILLNLCSQLGLMIHNLLLLEDMKDKVDKLAYLHQFNDAILQKSPVGISVMGKDGEVLTLNQAGLDILECKSRPATLPSLFGEEGPDSRIVELNGKTLLLYSTPMNVGDAAYRLVIFNDISENVTLRQELAQREHLAILGQVSASLAHEINTPLTGISSFAQILQESLQPEDRLQRYVSYITKETFYLSNLVGTLLKFTRSHEQDTTLLDVNEKIRDAIEIMGPLLEGRDFSVECHLTDTFLPVVGNETLLTQAILNITQNACQAVDYKGSVSIASFLRGETVIVTITDNGPGIPEEIKSSLGKPFISTGKGSGGTGLGLALSHAIITSYKGTILFEDAEGGGTEVRLELPRAEKHTDH